MKKLAIIGCGGIGDYHLEHFLKFDDIEISGLCDIIPERAEDFAKRSGGRAFTNYKEMYNAVKPDMVFICIPPYCHGEIEFETIRRGIPFFVEKPLALDIALAKEISEKIKDAALITASGFQCRYSNLSELAKKFAEENEVHFIDCVRMGGIPGTPWWGKRALSGGQIVEQTVHQFDIVRYCFGEPKSVFSYGATGLNLTSADYDTEDLSTTVVRFQNGALATFSTGCYADSGEAADSKVTFSARNARADLYILSKLNIYGLNDIVVNEKAATNLVKGDGNMTSAGDANCTNYTEAFDSGVVCDRTFIDAVISGDGSKIRSSYEDALKSVAFTLACNQSIDSGMPVEIVY